VNPHFSDDSVTVWHGDCLDVMREMPDNSVDSIVTDPPYGLGFMGKAWDDLPPGLPWAQECLRVLKPGGGCWPSVDPHLAPARRRRRGRGVRGA
jgi:DNA modification methylase